MLASQAATQPEISFGTLPGGEEWARIIRLLSVCERQLRKELAQQTAASGLTDTDFLLLFSCRQAGPPGIPQNELGAALGTSAASVSGLVEQLKRRGLLRVERGDSDRRRQYLRLSPDGLELVERLLVDLTSWTAKLQEKVTRDEIRRGEELLFRMTRIAHDIRTCTDNESAPGSVTPSIARQES